MEDKILEKYEVRKSNKEKANFIEYMKTRLEESGYDREKDITIEEKGKGIFKSRNIIVGDPGKAKVLLTAHYDTCAVLPFPNLMSPTNPFIFITYQLILVVLIFVMALLPAYVISLLTKSTSGSYGIFLIFLYVILFHVMFGYRNKHTANDNTSGVITITRILENLPAEHREKVCVVYFDNEEKGLFGSSFFRDKHEEEIKDKLLLNFDCVGDGRYITFISKRKARKDQNYKELLKCLEKSAKAHDVDLLIRKMKPMMFGSDQMHFAKGVGVCALKKSPIGMYVARIHTPFDTICREENVNYLVDGVCEFVGSVE